MSLTTRVRVGLLAAAALLAVAALATGARAFPDGAPVDACVAARANQPNHGRHRAQPPHTLPYRLAASAASYEPGDLITVTIEGAVPFKGFFIQARSARTHEWLAGGGGGGASGGGWEPAPHTTALPECAAVTHADPRDKTRATLVWRAPPASGRVYFTGTVLKDYGTFWADLVAAAPGLN